MLVEHLPGEPASFNVIPFDDPKGVVKLTARSREEKRFWTQQIKQAMLEHYDIPKRAKELVLLLGDEDGTFPGGDGGSSKEHVLMLLIYSFLQQNALQTNRTGSGRPIVPPFPSTSSGDSSSGGARCACVRRRICSRRIPIRQ